MTDEQVDSAISNWSARFTANGIDPSDFAEVTAVLDRWEDWCATWSRIGARHEELGRRALKEGQTRSAGDHLAQAATNYHFAKFLFVNDLAQMRTAHNHAVRLLSDALPFLNPAGQREVIPFGGSQLVGVLRLPPGEGLHPVVICIPGLDSAKEEFRPVESAFLDRGVGTFSVDGPGQGEAEYDLPIRPDWEIPGAAIIDHVAGLPGVDPSRIGIWGVSLGGYYAVRVAAGDTRVRACIALGGPYDYGATWDHLPSLTRDAFRVRSHTIDEQAAWEAAQALSLEGIAADVTCPLLVVFGKKDRLFDWEGAVRLSKEAQHAELLLLEEGNHGCANGIYKHRPYAADWMARQLSS